jgi:hypothetical protein
VADNTTKENETGSSSFDTNSVNENEIYRFLTTQYLHQNQLSWSRLQTAFAVEAGLLTWFFSSINSANTLVTLISMGLGSVVIWLLYQLILRDWDIRDQNKSLLEQIHSNRKLKIELLKNKCEKGLKGRYVVPWLTYGSVTINLALPFLRHCHLI